MDYDVIIVGAGPAGLSCALTLLRADQRCLILEARKELTGKVCGDGLSSHCMKTLKKIDIQEEDLAAWGGKKIYRNITSDFGRLEQRYYCANDEYENYAYGLSRDVFDNQLLKLVRSAGGQVKLGWKVKEIEKCTGGYTVDHALQAEHVVLACGAESGRNFGIEKPVDLPVGISARVRGNCNLASDSFYFKYDWQYGVGYAWLFPVGENLWNYGVWSANKRKNVRQLFEQLEQRLRQMYFLDEKYDRLPKGAFIGATRKETKKSFPCVGDCAYLARYESGEGISFAIESGYNQAIAILNNKETEKVKIPDQGKIFTRNLSYLNQEELFR